MARIVLFQHRPGATLLHRIDPRIKLLLLLSISGVAATGGVGGLAVATGAVVIGLVIMPISVLDLLRGFKVLLLMCLLIVAARVFSAETRLKGAADGALLSTRLILMALMASIYVATTPLSRTKAAVTWFLTPIPFVSAARVGVMIGLTLASISLLLDQYAETVAAVESRCIQYRHNPVRRAVFTLRPFLGKVFRRADEMALAMEARCYTDEATVVLDRLKRADWVTLVCIGLLVVVSVARRFIP